jgi:hypothetical protein
VQDGVSGNKPAGGAKPNAERPHKSLKVIRRRKEQEPLVFETLVSGIPDAMLPVAASSTDEERR